MVVTFLNDIKIFRHIYRFIFKHKSMALTGVIVEGIYNQELKIEGIKNEKQFIFQ